MAKSRKTQKPNGESSNDASPVKINRCEWYFCKETNGLQIINKQFLCLNHAQKSPFGSQTIANFSIGKGPFDQSNQSQFDTPNDLRNDTSNSNIFQTGFNNGVNITPSKFAAQRKQATPKSQEKDKPSTPKPLSLIKKKESERNLEEVSSNINNDNVGDHEALPVEAEFTLDHLLDQMHVASTDLHDPNLSLRSLFKIATKTAALKSHKTGISLADEANKSLFRESALLGMADNGNEIFLNLYEPFCVAAFGLQGSGKSHSLSVVVENCLLSTRELEEEVDREIIDLQNPMCCLVLHYDQSAQSVCEVTGLTRPRVGRSLCLPNDKMIVLVSPTYYLQRKAFYGPEINVRPLLFKWSKLTADHIRKLMRLSSDDTQLYVATLLDILRSYQRLNRLPNFKTFIEEVIGKADVKGQSAPLIQRLNILQSFVYESDKNASIQEFAIDLPSAIKSGTLIVADLSDPLLSKEEASGVFELLVETFRTAPLTGCGKLLALDECHKFMNGNGNEGLDRAILDAARLMRHDGLRLVLSSQSPLAITAEILELISVAILHRFQSRDWFQYLKSKIELDERTFDAIQSLAPGAALVYAGRKSFSEDVHYIGKEMFQLQVRPRITQDRGSSLVNKGVTI